MGLGRKRGARRWEYASYLASHAWLHRKIRYYKALKAAGFIPVCQVCGCTQSHKRPLDLHHLSYEGVAKDAQGNWVSKEKDEDLVPLCREHHQKLHQVLDQRGRDFRGWSRDKASIHIIKSMKRRVNN